MSRPLHMPRRFAGILVIAALVAVTPPVAASHTARPGANTKLAAVVGPNDTEISLSDADGKLVSHLDPGTYTIVVDDRSSTHNFHLFGPGVDRATAVSGIGQQTWTVTFVDGYYQYLCDPHRAMMHGAFTVGTGKAPPVKLIASIGPGRSIGLWTGNQTRVSKLHAGDFVITVHDRSHTDNFRLVGPGVIRSTGIPFRGTVRWSVTFAPGAYVYRSDKHRTLRGRFVATADTQANP